MSETNPELTAVCQLGTWRSGGRSPGFPGRGDADRLLRTVGRANDGGRASGSGQTNGGSERTNADSGQAEDGGCTVVRVRLAAPDEGTLRRVREHLLDEGSIVGTSIGCDAGPDGTGAFDILVVPGHDPVAVGRAIASVEDVVGVAAATFDTATASVGDSGTPGLVGEADPDGRTGDDPTAVGGGPAVSPVVEPDDDATAPVNSETVGVSGLAALDDGATGDASQLPGVAGDGAAVESTPVTPEDRQPVAAPGGQSRATGDANPESASTPNSLLDDDYLGDGRVPARRVEALESRLSSLGVHVDGGTQAGRPGGLPTADREAILDRIESLETAVATLARRQRRMEQSLFGESP